MRDLDEVFERLKGSAFRRRFKLGRVENEYLRTRGLDEVLEHAGSFIGKRIAPAQPGNDGKQTPFHGHPVFVAQHATATCCRGCIEKWYGIPRGRELSEVEQRHLRAAIERWLSSQPTSGEAPVQHDLWS